MQAIARPITRNLFATSRLRLLRSHIIPVRSMASIPQIMKGVLVEETGGVEVLQYKTDLPISKLKQGELLVKNEFIGINYIDT